MFDNTIREQLRTYLGALSSDITLRMFDADHPNSIELAQMLEAVAGASPKITFERAPEQGELPMFALLANHRETGIRFFGAPGGHELSSLVLAVLNADGKGKLPPADVARRVASLAQPIHLRTFISLSCTNCPDVVQALNQLALVGDRIRHDVIDGALTPEEVSRLGIQGVPAVFEGDALLHVGKAGLGELLERIEGHAGVIRTAAPTRSEFFDVIVLGGGPAGVSAAIYSARKGLRTALVAKRIGGQINDTLGIENFISVPYTDGPSLSSALATHLDRYPVTRFEHRSVDTVLDGAEKQVVLNTGDVVRGAQLIVATGAKWRELGVPGEREHLGRGVAFCPHCDGPFFKGRRVAVVGGGNSGVEAAIDLAGIASRVTLLEFTESLKADSVLVSRLEGLSNVSVVLNARTTEVLGDGKRVTGIRWEERRTGAIDEKALDGIFVQIGLVPNSDMVAGLLRTNRFGEIEVDERGRTTLPGIYAAGDVAAGTQKQIVVAMGTGATAALTAFEDRMRSATG